jgi:hypothetical protein
VLRGYVAFHCFLLPGRQFVVEQRRQHATDSTATIHDLHSSKARTSEFSSF